MWVLVGTSDGSLLLYALQEGPVFGIQLVETRKSFSKKAVNDLAVYNNGRSFLCLTDGQLDSYDLSTMSLNARFPKTKGATCFKVFESSRNRQREATGGSVDRTNGHGSVDVTRLAVVVKRRVMLYRLEVSRGVVEWKEDGSANLSDRPRSLLWIDEHRLAFAVPRGYSFVTFPAGNVTDLLVFGGNIVNALALGGLTAPVKIYKQIIVKLDNGQLLLTKDAAGVFVNDNGAPLIERDLEWPQAPDEVYFCPPYVVSIINQTVEVRSLKSGGVVQKIDLYDSRLMMLDSLIYIASGNSIWRLLPLDFEDQIEQLISASRFIEAQRLIEELEFSTEDEKMANVIRVRGLYAHHLFTYDKKYEEAISMLAELKASPIDVINLFPQFSLLVQQAPSTITSPTIVPTPDLTLQPQEERVALKALMDYLINQRTVLAKLRHLQKIEQQQNRNVTTSPLPSAAILSTHGNPSRHTSSSTEASNSIWSGSGDGYPDGYNMRFPSVDDTLYLCEVVDSTLLRVYLEVNDALVGPFVRIKNFCSLQEGERVLHARGKVSDLIDFYFTKGEHARALKLLLKRANESNKEKKPLIRYLQRLELGSHMTLIFESSIWLLDNYPDEGLSV
ncbi:Vam6/Vps39-like protein [Irineochytrium annulatum]|nr:Vam6/Vps39-like protein [Irineochytrium annulatum]